VITASANHSPCPSVNFRNTTSACDRFRNSFMGLLFVLAWSQNTLTYILTFFWFYLTFAIDQSLDRHISISGLFLLMTLKLWWKYITSNCSTIQSINKATRTRSAV